MYVEVEFEIQMRLRTLLRVRRREDDGSKQSVLAPRLWLTTVTNFVAQPHFMAQPHYGSA